MLLTKKMSTRFPLSEALASAGTCTFAEVMRVIFAPFLPSCLPVVSIRKVHKVCAKKTPSSVSSSSSSSRRRKAK